MATLSEGGRISEIIVDEEIIRLKNCWSEEIKTGSSPHKNAVELMGAEAAEQLDLFEQYLLMGVSDVCKESKSMAEAGRKLFNVSRLNKTVKNDSHRLKQLLAKFDLSFSDVIEK
jgi:transcriptional regulatory protein RtcR